MLFCIGVEGNFGPDEKSHGQHSTQRDPEGVLRFLFRHEINGSGGGIPLEESGVLSFSSKLGIYL